LNANLFAVLGLKGSIAEASCFCDTTRGRLIVSLKVSGRSNADKRLGEAALELRAAFSSDEEIKRELHAAVDRVMQDE